VAVSVHSFKEAYPDFRDTSNVLVRQKLSEAEKRVAKSIWSGKTDIGVMALTAHLLSLSPNGEVSRIDNEQRVSTYTDEWKRLIRENTMGAGRVI
jgi:hypothetical protein